MSRERPDLVVRRFALVTLVLPAVVTTVGLVVQLAALPQAPARIPLFWDRSGAPSGWEPAWLPLVLTVVLGFGLPAVVGLSSLPGLRRGDRSPAFRLFGAQALGISVLLTIAATFFLLQGIGTTSSDGSRVGDPLVVGLAAGIPAALVGWLLHPKGSLPAPHPPSRRQKWPRRRWTRWQSSMPVPWACPYRDGRRTAASTRGTGTRLSGQAVHS